MIVHKVEDNLRRISQIAFGFDQEHKIITSFDELKDYSNVTILMDEKSVKEHLTNAITKVMMMPELIEKYKVLKYNDN